MVVLKSHNDVYDEIHVFCTAQKKYFMVFFIFWKYTYECLSGSQILYVVHSYVYYLNRLFLHLLMRVQVVQWNWSSRYF